MIEGIEKVKDSELLGGIYKLYNEVIDFSSDGFIKNKSSHSMIYGINSIITTYIWGINRPSCIRDGGAYLKEIGVYRVELLVENDYQHINDKIHLYFNIDKELIRDNRIDKVLK